MLPPPDDVYDDGGGWWIFCLKGMLQRSVDSVDSSGIVQAVFPDELFYFHLLAHPSVSPPGPIHQEQQD